jgi:hypothetical protein
MIPASGVEADFRGKPNFAHFVRPEDINSALALSNDDAISGSHVQRRKRVGLARFFTSPKSENSVLVRKSVKPKGSQVCDIRAALTSLADYVHDVV